MAVKPKGVWGIDIGQCALKALRLELVEGKPTATAFDYVEHTKILSQPDADPDTLIREALEKFLSRNEVKLDDVAIGIAGQSGLARFVKLPPVEEKKIAEIVKFEAKQQIPFPLDEVVWDFQKIAGGEAVDGFALETEIGLFAMKRDVISRYLGYFNASRIEVHTVQMSPLALVNFATYELLKKGGPAPGEGEEEAPDDAPRGKKRCVVVMDIGTDASNLIITDGAKIIWQRPIPLGGNHFTRALTKELKLTFAKAEHLKRNAAKSPEMANILKAIKPVLTDFVGEVQRSLGYFTNTHRDAHVAYMVGLGSAFKLPGLQKYLGDKLSLEVRKPAKFARLGGEAIVADPLFLENLLTFPVAYGLALQGLGQARLTTNLLPHEIRMDRVVRAKKPYAVAAAAMLLLGTGALALGSGLELKSVTNPKIDDGIKAAKAAGSAYSGAESEYSQRKQKSESTQNDVRAILAGQEQRLNWARFLEVQTAAMPKPGDPKNGGNLDPGIWVGAGNAGMDALRWFEGRMRDGVKIEEALNDATSKHPANLAIVNVEAFNSRWVHNVGAFLEHADTVVFDSFGDTIAKSMRPDETENDEAKGRLRPKKVEGGGWIIEIRGYTDHHDPQFLHKALLKNLNNADKFATAKGEDKIGKYIVGVADPVKGKVSHAFIFKTWLVSGAAANSFQYINESRLDAMLGGGTSSSFGPSGPGEETRGGGPPAPPGSGQGDPAQTTQTAAAALGPGWSPLTGGGASSSSYPGAPSSGAPPAGKGGMSARLGKIPGQSSPSGREIAGTGGPDIFGTSGKDAGQENRKRYEFVVMMVWREPVPDITPTAGPTTISQPGGGTSP
jgi:type IV pilus assembly protein PilM